MKYIDIDPETRHMRNELLRLSEETDSSMASQILRNFAKGLETVEDNWHLEPFLAPEPIEGADVVFVGPPDSEVGDLHCKKIDGANTSIWRTDNFFYRWSFFVHGLLAVRFWGTPPPIELRLDTQAMGFQIEKQG